MPYLLDTDRFHHSRVQSGSDVLWPQYSRVRSATLRLCEGLCTEDFVIQSMPDASPAKWHLAHTTWFFDTFVLARLGHGPCGKAEYGYLFNSYYNGVGPMHQRDRRGMLSRPTLA